MKKEWQKPEMKEIPPLDMRKLYGEICDLAIHKNEGAPLDVHMMAMRSKINKLMLEVNNLAKSRNYNRGDMMKEMGHVQILLFELMQRFGVCFDSYMDAVSIQHFANKKQHFDER